MQSYKTSLNKTWTKIIDTEEEFTILNESSKSVYLAYTPEVPTDKTHLILLKPQEGWLSAYGIGTIWAKTVGNDNSSILIIK